MAKDTLVTLLKCKRWIDSETLKTINVIDGSAYAEKRHLRLMNHIYVVDMIFKANMTGRQHGYTALNTPETPSVEELAVKKAEGTKGYIQQLKAMTSADLGETMTFSFVDGGNGAMTAMEMLNPMLFQGTYHRGAVGWLVSECSAVPPKDVLTVFLRDHNH